MSGWRVNFGNGQVHYAGSKAQCELFIARYGDAWTYLQRLDVETGEWFEA